MKKINTQGITYLESFPNTQKWYWGSDAIHGDLYEYEEAFCLNLQPPSNRLIFVEAASGEIFEPKILQKGQYFAVEALYEQHYIYFFWVDFMQGSLHIDRFNALQYESVATIALNGIKDCKDLHLNASPLMLTKHSDDVFEIIYPTHHRLPISNDETFCFQKDNTLYFTKTTVTNDTFFEEVILRDVNSLTLLNK